MPAGAQTEFPAVQTLLPSETGHGSKTTFWALTLGSVGVVYGDIGTSPLYALKESLHAASGGQAPTREMVFGVVSLILWALILIVTLKYVFIVMRADNDGEGGTPSLVALAQRALGRSGGFVLVLGMVGISLFYGDAIITPAISVLSAVEGLKLATPAFDPYVLPLSLAILIGLFTVQSHGTARVATFFGPITAFWFLVMALGGLSHLVENPSILAAFNPAHGIAFLLTHGTAGLLALGAVFLAVTGAEALYADMGHFGRSPIRTAWLGLVLPALALNYLGQGAMLLAHPDRIENPFFLLYPSWALLPMILLATVATIIASQAVITGTFSITQQAMQLGLLPRMRVQRTSETEKGQIYIPRVNWWLLAAVVFLAVLFKSSSALAAAYGIAVTGDMVITATLVFVVAWRFWRWSPALAALVIAPFLLVELVFLSANALKLLHGGWVPLTIGAGLVTAMWTWRRGSALIAAEIHRRRVPLSDFARMAETGSILRAPGTAVFLTGSPDDAPGALMHNVKHNHVLHARNLILHVVTDDLPRVPEPDRVTVRRLSDAFSYVTLRFGFMELPDLPTALAAAGFDTVNLSYFLTRRVLVASPETGMPVWQDRLYIAMALAATDASRYFRIPADRAVEIGARIDI
ncbi:Low affinity potassium transport system protein kup [Methylobacterium tardum]|uniref:Probable potassium transport system protein Kup n=1 Tax=Methylobacterium tardum TaxID=374432 RepID=A0AA37WTR0_9HYPH|nr:potassium transporter Kup [Methylobacterium tardum]GJE48720.1 Low affinity potassium transport system protein kup [Methylobacterium tardum]GLS72384.1 putative potassium transport system protein kup 2 [Methylobacterium tardum]